LGVRLTAGAGYYGGEVTVEKSRSEASGAPISIERLEASPESLYTLDEQKSRDTAR